jgi:hypothetical protein
LRQQDIETLEINFKHSDIHHTYRDLVDAEVAMSSGFVSGGSLDTPAERDDEWHKAQQELDEGRKRKMELDKLNAGKSLFEVLQANQGEFIISILLCGITANMGG